MNGIYYSDMWYPYHIYIREYENPIIDISIGLLKHLVDDLKLSEIELEDLKDHIMVDNL